MFATLNRLHVTSSLMWYTKQMFHPFSQKRLLESQKTLNKSPKPDAKTPSNKPQVTPLSSSQPIIVS